MLASLFLQRKINESRKRLYIIEKIMIKITEKNKNCDVKAKILKTEKYL